MSKQAAVLIVFIALGISTGRVLAIVVDEWVPFTQPDGTTFTAHIVSDEVAGSMFTGDGYAFVYNDTDGYSYYAELDAQGEYPQGYVLDEQGYIRNAQGDYVASSYRVGIDDPPGYNLPTAVQERSWGTVKYLFHK